MLGRNLLYLPCRHHIFEMLLGGIFDFFNKFRNDWQNNDQKKFKVGLEDKKIGTCLENHIKEIQSFSKSVLNSQIQPRDDYCEFLLLSLIFIDKIPREQVKFSKSGSVSRAHWMAKAIYCLKIYLFRDVFHLTLTELTAIRKICTFILVVYLKTWFEAPFANSAPNNDLKNLKKLHDFGKINLSVSKIGIKKFSNHWWYLSPESATMSFFDEKVSDDIKKNMVLNLKNDEFVGDNEKEVPKCYNFL